VDEEGRRRTTRAGLRVESGNVTSIQHGMARTGGMGTRRQSRATEPDRPDDSQHREHRSLHRADRDQWVDEGYAARTPHMSERPEVQEAGRTRYDEDELDNQDPHGKHAAFTLDEQPQELRSESRVGEEIKPGIDLEIERAGLRRDGPAEEGNRGESN
jgi:hypothetical protein